jgi:hypothetical protein
MNQAKECDCDLREEFDKMKKEKEQDCKNKLFECQKNSSAKDRQMKELKKKHTVMLVLVVIVATVLGKETVDGIAEWVESLNNVKSQVETLTTQADPIEYDWSFQYGGGVAPAPGALPLLAMAGLVGGGRRRRR